MPKVTVISNPSPLEFISKSRLTQLMEDWGSAKITTEEMSLWCRDNYFPLSQTYDPSVPLWQQRAIESVLASFEWQANDGEITAKREGWSRAVEFLNCSEAAFEEAEDAFYRECAG